MQTQQSDPIFVTVKEAARLLGLTVQRTYELCDAGALVSQWEDGVRLVRHASLAPFADSLPAAAS